MLTEEYNFTSNTAKMRVKLAAQVLGHTVAAAMCTFIFCDKLPSDAKGTADFIEMIDQYLIVLILKLSMMESKSTNQVSTPMNDLLQQLLLFILLWQGN